MLTVYIHIIHYIPTDCRIRRIHTISSTDYPGYGLSRHCQVSRLDNVWKRRRTRITRYREMSEATDLKFGTPVHVDNFSKMREYKSTKRHGLGLVTLVTFGTRSNISLKRIKLQTRNLPQGCIRTISPKWPIKISVKGRGLGHVTL